MENGPAHQPQLPNPNMNPAAMNVAPAAAEHANLLAKVGNKLGHLATSAYEFATTTVGRLTSGETKKAGLVGAAVVVGGFALKAYGARHGIDMGHGGGAGTMASHDVMSQVNTDHANFELADYHTPLAEAPAPSASYDPLFDHEGNGTSDEGHAVLIGTTIAAGTAAVIGSTVAVARRGPRARRDANNERDYYDQQRMIALRALHARADLADRHATRRTGTPHVDPVGRRRYDLVDGTPWPNQDPLREYHPNERVPRMPRRRGFFRRMFSRRRLRP